jgi:ABC-type sugar transport system ATPase subunit
MTVTVPPSGHSPGLGRAQPFLQTRSLGKRFGAVVALDDVDFSANLGEVTALVGDNGAGKSTLIKVIAGAHPATTGDVWVEGAKVKFASPIDAGNHGIATIYQELALADNLSVYENVFLGRELTRSVAGVPLLDRRAMRKRVEQVLTDLDAHLPSVTTQVANLSGGSGRRSQSPVRSTSRPSSSSWTSRRPPWPSPRRARCST